MHPAIKTTFSVLIVLQFLAVTLHDWLHIPGWTHGRQVQSQFNIGKFAIISLVNAIFPGIAVAFIFFYRTGPKPSFVANYWVIYCAITVVSAVMMWWVPYFFGSDQKTKQQYQAMYAGTIHVLPARGENPRPNLLHICFHALFLLTFCLSILLRAS